MTAGLPAALLLVMTAGCLSTESLPDEAPVVELQGADTQEPYLLYVPSVYDNGRAWPLVVLSHGTWPYDTADFQMREWARFAEQKGIIVVAPRLRGTRGDFPPPPEEQIALQRGDERTILDVVETVKRQFNIAEHQVFMAGWSAGAYAMLHTGLRHPELFRALFLRQPSFDARFMDVPKERLDDWQAIKVVYGQGDVITRDQSKACIAWMREQGLHVEEMEYPGSHRRLAAEEAWKYFTDVARRRMWAQLRTAATNPGNTLAIRFSLVSVPEAEGLRWSFGDGETSAETTPVHEYPRPGKYEVSIRIELPNGKSVTRRRTINVGRAG